MKSNLIKVVAIILLITIVFVSFSQVYGATTPTLVNKLNSILKKIKEYMVKLAGPAAALAIATGVMIRKLSFGDEEKYSYREMDAQLSEQKLSYVRMKQAEWVEF